MSNPQGEAAAGQASSNAQLADLLSNESLPMFSRMFGVLENQLAGGPDAIIPFVKDAFDKSRANLNVTYDQAGRTGSELTRYRALTSDNPYTQGEVVSTLGRMGFGLEQERQAGIKNLNFQESQVSLNTYNALLNALSGGANSALSLGAGFNTGANSAISGLPKSGTGENILGGALTGAVSGGSMTSWNPYGIAAGAVIGGVMGGIRGGG